MTGPSPDTHPVPVVGLTGLAGSGKSFVASLFQRLCKAAVIDADRTGHQILMEKTVIKSLVKTFGEDILRDGAVHRPSLAGIVFGNPDRLKQLNRIVHPHMLEQIRNQIAQPLTNNRYYLLDAAILFESDMHHLCSSTICVEAPFSVRFERMKERGWSVEELRQRDAAQPADKSGMADHILDGSAKKENLEKKVLELDRLLRYNVMGGGK